MSTKVSISFAVITCVQSKGPISIHGYLDPSLHSNKKFKSFKSFCLLSYVLHFCVLQEFLSVLLPMHAFPPCLAVLATVLRLFCDPPPQDLEHFDHPPQEDHMQCTEKLNEIILIINLGTFLL